MGPCSIHDRVAGLEYARRLTTLSKEVEESLLLVMRVYFEKPRTTVGWKGLIMDPHLDGSNDIPTGLRIASIGRVERLPERCAVFNRPHDPDRAERIQAIRVLHYPTF